MSDLTEATRCAHWGWTEHRYFGRAVFGELLGRETVTSLTVLSVLGRPLPEDCLGLIDDMAVSLTLADPRIWPLKLTRLLASYGGAVAALGGGLSLQEGARLGPWTGQEAAGLLVDFKARLAGQHESPERVREHVLGYLKTHRFVWGFGTPFRDHDERLVAFRQRIELRGRHTSTYWRLFDAISAVMIEARGVQPNMGMGVAAACLDMGIGVTEVGPLATALMQHMFLANAMEQAGQPSSALRKLPDTHVKYVGQAPRQSARARQSSVP